MTDTPDHCGWVHVPDEDEAWREELRKHLLDEFACYATDHDLDAIKAIATKAPRVDEQMVERLVYPVANAKLGEGPAVRCEGPTEYELRVAREWITRVLAALTAALGRKG